MTRIYSVNSLKQWSKDELIKHILCLQENLEYEKYLNNHVHKTLSAVMHKNVDLSNAVCEVLGVWNASAGHRYINDVEVKK